ncbi:hypothetical protein BsWGS_18542 [Bradybaena similaris]
MASLIEQTSPDVTTPAVTQPSVRVSALHNGSSNNESAQYIPEFYKDAQIGFLVFLFFFIVIGNVIVLAAIALSKERRRSRMNFFIMNLAVCDLLNGPLIVLSDLITKVTIYWYAGAAFCKLHKFSQVLVMYASTYMLVALSVDRLDAVARPLHFTASWFRIKILVGIAWALSCIFAIPELILFDVSNVHGGPMCNIGLSSLLWWQVYIGLIAVSVFFIPAFIILVCYLAIIIIIFNSTHLINSMSNNTTSTNGETLRETSSRHKRNAQCQSSRGIIPQAKIRTIKMTFIIVFGKDLLVINNSGGEVDGQGVRCHIEEDSKKSTWAPGSTQLFIMCWSPYFIFNLCHVFGAWPRSDTVIKLTTFIQSLAPLNSAVNPIIYGIFSTRVCRYIRRAPMVSRVPQSMSRCCLNNNPTTPKESTADYTTISEVDDFRLSGDSRHSITQNGCSRIPLIRQQLTEADKELLSLHIRATTTT